jgi:hypothetical protein
VPRPGAPMVDPRGGPRHDTGAIAQQEAHRWCRQVPFPTEARKEPIVIAELDTRHPSQPRAAPPQ